MFYTYCYSKVHAQYTSIKIYITLITNKHVIISCLEYFEKYLKNYNYSIIIVTMKNTELYTVLVSSFKKLLKHLHNENTIMMFSMTST